MRYINLKELSESRVTSTLFDVHSGKVTSISTVDIRSPPWVHDIK